MSVVLINLFEVQEDQEEAFLKGWREAASVLRQAPGFLSTRLHESLNKEVRFRFVNIAQWESPQHLQTALSNEAFEQSREKMPFTAFPTLYRVIADEEKSPSL